MTTFNQLLDKYRSISFSERDKGDRFERLMQAYLLTDPKYAYQLKKVWLWNEFPAKLDLGVIDSGIDLVALTDTGEYWAIQCKCFQENATIDKPAVDSFLSTSSRTFKDDAKNTVHFSQRIWISTTNKWGPNATEAIKNQHPAVTRINLLDLQESFVDWEKLDKGISGELSRTAKRDLKAHQKVALENTHEHFKTADRGKLIMACGTGKTFNSLRIAENETNGKGLILFLVPSIALLGQTLREWSAFANEPINAICICSDPEISKKKTKNEDSDTFSVVDLAMPASTNTKDILHQFNRIKTKDNKGMTVVFSTYQSIEVIARAQKELLANGFNEFDLVICDEAHRTTGVSLAGEDASAFIKVHDNTFIKAKKRLYMTATPRLYSADSVSKAAQADAVLCSMDDEKLYGKEIYRIGFGEAVEKDLLTDYKVLILTLNDKDIPPAVQQMIKGEKSEITTDDASKLIGCINALSKQILGDEGIIKASDPEPMRRAVAFCSSISTSEKITSTFKNISDVYPEALPTEKKDLMVAVDSKHIDGTMSAPIRDELLGWLKAEPKENECRVLTNVRCLSEGVDVPSLDAVLFLSARNSQVDVVQSVGRVMRKSPGKKYGYIIIPVVVPSDVDAVTALDDNERYKVVWTVLNALRAHDDRFNATVNKIDLNRKKPEQVVVGRTMYSFGEDGVPILAEDQESYGKKSAFNKQLAVQFEQLQDVVFARMVKKVGERGYWEQWAKSVGEIAERQIARIKRLIVEDKKHQKAFDNFLVGLQKNINPSISEQQAVEMLSQHIITRPIFDALFEGYSFIKNNPISISMQSMLDLLEEQTLAADAEMLQKFYNSVKTRISGIDNAEGKQAIIIRLYDSFFKTAFPKMVEQLGIVYTPVEVVDFIIHSANDILKNEFGRSLSDEGVHILDPFTGTGTFMTRLLQSGLIDKKDLARKYKHELHANEIVLLAYYIAAVNIENTYHDVMGEVDYTPFDGICLTDTFQLGEIDDNKKIFAEMFPQNSERVKKQKKAPLKIIIGNPPYSRGQEDGNDNAQNQNYPILENQISKNYATGNNATLSRDLYNSYIKAFRWSTDRLKNEESGIIAFITGSGWLEKNSYAGFRKSLEKEFSSIYVFNLKGDIRGRGKEAAKREGQNVFDIMTGVAITFLVKKPKHIGKAKISYLPIADYLNRKEKISFIQKTKTISKIEFALINPNNEGDWINQRSTMFDVLLPLAPDKKFDIQSKTIFITYAVGIGTNRDHWVYNYSQLKLLSNMKEFIQFYNSQRKDFHNVKINNLKLSLESFISSDDTKIKWTRSLRKNLEKNLELSDNTQCIQKSTYRPFNKEYLYFDKNVIESPGLSKSFFPNDSLYNAIISIPGTGGVKDFYVLATNTMRDLDTYGGCQCFPFYYYEERKKQAPGIFDEAGESEYIRRDGISDFIFEQAKKQYGVKDLSKEDIFYYVYGLLHSPEYRELFSNDLKKMLPRLPLVEDVRDFWEFSKAGKALAALHINYENVPAYKSVTITGDDSKFYTVEKMRFPKKGQKDIIFYNSKITISNIPDKAYEYVVNGKSAIEWIMERYAVTTHKESGIKNDPNDWATEVGNPRYILDLLLSIINVSLQTVDIVEGLPKVTFE